MKGHLEQAGPTGGRRGRGPSSRPGRTSCHLVAAAILLAAAPIGASAGEPGPRVPDLRADRHGVRTRSAQASPRWRTTPTARAAAVSSAATPEWEFLGVWGGDVDVVAVSPTDPDLVLAGVGSGNIMIGGLYRSTDRGATWSSVAHRDLSRIPVDAIEWAPDGTVYVGTPWYLWSSSDGGVTWVHHELPSAGDWVRTIAVDPTDPSTLWVGVGNQVLRSTDWGESWIDRTPPGSTMTCYAVALDPTGGDRVFVATSDVYASSSRLYVSDDGGGIWHDHSAGLPDNPIFDIAHDGHRVLVVGGLAYNDQPFGIYASSNLGLTWTPLHDADWPVRYVSDVEVDPRNPSTILLATDAGVFRSDDGGESWQFGVGDTAAMTIRSVRLAPDGSGRLLAGDETRGVLTSDGPGADFEVSSVGIGRLYVTSTAANPLDPDEIAIAFHGTNRGGVYTTRDGGATWLRESCPPTRYVKLAFSPVGVLHAVSNGPTTVAAEGVYRRDPDGAWVHLGPDQGPLFDTDLWSLHFSAGDPRLIIATGGDSNSAGSEGVIWRSADGGASWTKIYESAQPYRVVTDLEIVEDGTDTGMLASWLGLDAPSGGVLRSIDGGLTWDAPVDGLPAGVVPVALGPSPRGPGVFFLADIWVPGGVWVTGDGGATWTLTGFAGTPVWDVVSHPTRADRIYIAMDDGPAVWVSDDGGDHFSSFDDGLDLAGYALELALSRDAEPRLLLSTSDGSFVRTLANPPPRTPGRRIAP